MDVHTRLGVLVCRHGPIGMLLGTYSLCVQKFSVAVIEDHPRLYSFLHQRGIFIASMDCQCCSAISQEGQHVCGSVFIFVELLAQNLEESQGGVHS